MLCLQCDQDTSLGWLEGSSCLLQVPKYLHVSFQSWLTSSSSIFDKLLHPAETFYHRLKNSECMVYQVWSIVPKYLETIELGSTQLTNCGGFCWSKVLLPEYPCWWQLAHSSDLAEDVRVLSGITYTVFVPYIITVCACDLGHYKNLYCIVLYNIVPSVLWCCWLGGKKGIRPVKTEWWGTSAVICLERGANDLHMVQLMPLSLHHLLLQ